MNDELHDIEGKLSGGDVRERVRAISVRSESVMILFAEAAMNEIARIVSVVDMKQKQQEPIQSAGISLYLMTRISE